jgi:tRNA(adenine34) deaminase
VKPDAASGATGEREGPIRHRQESESEDLRWMREALGEAKLAEEHDDVPVGAVVVVGGRLLARGRNRTVLDRDPSAHAEVVALRAAAAALGDHRVGGTLYVTLEPCLMCMGALVQARVERLVFAARDPKAGAAVSLYEIAGDTRLNHRFPVHEGPLREEAGDLLREFFRRRRSGGPRGEVAQGRGCDK